MQQQKRHSADVFFVLSLFCLYTLSALFLAVIGANVYERNVAISEANYNIRTSALYVTEKARQSEALNRIRVDSFNENDALVLSREVDGQIFETWIYVEDDFLSEVLVPAGTTLIPGIGQKIMPLAALDLSMETNGLLEISVTDLRDNHFVSKVYLECAPTEEDGLVMMPAQESPASEEDATIEEDSAADEPTVPVVSLGFVLGHHNNVFGEGEG